MARLSRPKMSKMSPEQLRRQTSAKLNAHWLNCKMCSVNGDEVDGDVVSFICSTCVARKLAAAPDLPKQLTQEEKDKKAARKAARLKRKEAIARGEVPQKAGNFGRGWWFRKLFKIEVDGKMCYFSKGKEITADQYAQIEREEAQKASLAKEKATGRPRGWHLKKRFVAANGDVYCKGKLVKKGKGKSKK